MEIDSVSPRSQPLPLRLQIPPLWLPGPLMPTPAHSRESSMSTLRMESGWPPKWDPSPTTPPFSYEDLYNPTPDTLEGIPNTPPTPHLRTQDQPDPATTEWWNARNDPPPTLPQPLVTALANARSTTSTLATLSSLLTQLLTSPPKTASGCPTRIPHHDPAATTPAAVTDSWLLQVLLPLHPTLDHAPAALHALQRLCMHAAAVAADDVHALQDRAAVSPKRFARFVAKWAAFGEGADDDDDGGEDDEDDEPSMTPTRGSAQAESQGEEFSVADCLDFVAAFTEVWEGRRGIRVRGGGGGGGRRRVRDAAVEAGDGDGAAGGREVSARVLERCRANVAHVLALLDRVAAELDAEVEIRANCTHSPVRCRNLGAADAGLWVARGHIDGMMVAVEGDREALMGWKGRGIQAGERDDGGRREVGQGRLVRRWMHLSEREGGWGWGLVMRADEIVRRIGAGTWVDLRGRGGVEKRLELR